MDDQFLIVRRPSQFQEGTADVFTGNVIPWSGTMVNGRGYFKPWNSNAVKTFDGDVQRVKLQDIETFIQSVSLKPSEKNESTNADDFSIQIGKIKNDIHNDQIDKVVLSRVRWVDSSEFRDSQIDGDQVLRVFQKACDKYEHSFVYLMFTNDYGVWIGATPEILIELKNGSMRTMSLAGTLFNEDEVWTSKEKHEQSITARHITETLSALGLKENVSDLTEIKNGSVRHLVQYHKANITNMDVEKLISMLHPTPAVAGYPIEDSVEMIQQLERHERELYTGIIGTSDEIYVNLRCAQIFSNGIKLYAGCGINSQSDAEREWQETELKMKVIGDLFVV